MPLIVISLMGDEEEDQITKKAPLVKEKPQIDRYRRLREQVININGDIVEI